MQQIKKNNDYKNRIGIIGGTFDPIHYGHLIAADWVRDSFSLDKVIFMPAGRPPHKLNKKVLPAEHRYNMTLLATNHHPSFEVSTMEIKREGPSYTIDTINELRKIHLEEDTQLLFITGADAILSLPSWERFEELMSKCSFIAVNRGGYKTELLYKEINSLYKRYGNKIFTIEIPTMGISSTELRERIADNKSIQYLVPYSVEQYIKKNKLYQT